LAPLTGSSGGSWLQANLTGILSVLHECPRRRRSHRVDGLKTHLSAVLDEVIAGRQVTITRHGHPIAQRSPAAAPTREHRRQASQGIREIATATKPLPTGVTIEGLYKEVRL